jgi:hypothetical protein
MKYMHPESAEAKAAEDAKRKQLIDVERRRWWELAETYRRCVQIAGETWETDLDIAQLEQRELAIAMRDRTAPGVRATGKTYDADKHIPVPLFTPRDRVQFLKEVATTLLISADRQNLPVTPEAKRAAQAGPDPKPDEAGDDPDDPNGDEEAEELAEAGEAAESAARAQGIPAPA